MNNKYNFKDTSIFNGKTTNKLNTNFFVGVVVSNDDKSDANRIRVRVRGVDDHLSDNELPFCFPMQTKFFSITPKIDEVVFIIVPSSEFMHVDRVYFGPVISQPQMLLKDTFINGSTNSLDRGFSQQRVAPSTIPENKGVFPNKEDVSIQGRDNADIILKSKEVLLRAGKFELNTKPGEIPKFNFDSPSYIQIKNNVVLNKKEKVIEKGGVINVVSNKINLLTHKNGSPKFGLNDPESMISASEMEKILAEAHPMVFGDLLVSYLKLLRNAFIGHVHPYNGLTAEDLSGKNDVDKYLEFDLNSILSSNIKIN
jgi:hypothetical protein